MLHGVACIAWAPWFKGCPIRGYSLCMSLSPCIRPEIVVNILSKFGLTSSYFHPTLLPLSRIKYFVCVVDLLQAELLSEVSYLSTAQPEKTNISMYKLINSETPKSVVKQTSQLSIVLMPFTAFNTIIWLELPLNPPKTGTSYYAKHALGMVCYLCIYQWQPTCCMIA